MRNDPIIGSLMTLYEDANVSVTTEQRQHLVLAYGSSLLKRCDAQLLAREEERDEIAIALCMRAAPIFGFISIDEENVAPAIRKSRRQDVSLSGKYETRHALRGELNNRFGVSALATLALPKGQLERVD